MAAADCYSVGEQVAAQYGGTLAKASQQNRGGQTVCVIVVLVPGKDGQRPRRTEVVVPANLALWRPAVFRNAQICHICATAASQD